MKIFTSFLFLFVTLTCIAQNPLIVKPLASTVTEPKNKDQNEWQNNLWNGKRFYMGTGSGALKLCVTDGTSAGTTFLADLSANASAILNFIPAKDFIYIAMYNFPSGAQTTDLWKSDGTVAGTTLIYTFPGIAKASFQSDALNHFNYSVDGNTMYFAGYDLTNGIEPWRTDGTPAGTYMLKNIKAANGDSYPGGFCKLGNTTLFRAAYTGFDTKLFKTDGTEAGTVEVPVPGLSVWDAAIGRVNNKMIFYGNDAVNGPEPWVTDGTPAGTFLLADIYPGTTKSLPSSVQNLHLKFNSKYCFFLANNVTGVSLWRTDGTIQGTIKLTPDGYVTGSNFTGGGYSAIDENGLYWITGNQQLYFSDGTVAGTRKITGSLNNIQYMTIYKKNAWFHGRDNSVVNAEPWRSDGTTANTKRAFEIQPGTLPSEPYGFFNLNDKLYFFSNYASGKYLYQYTGDMTFNGSVAGLKWSDSANWNSMMPPGINDTAFIPAGATVNLNSGAAFAGVLNVGTGTTINLSAATDSLYIHNSLNNSGGNGFSGNGVLVMKNFNGDTSRLYNSFTVSRMNVQGNASLNGALSITGDLNLTNDARFVLNNNDLVLKGSSSTLTNANGGYILTNGTGNLAFENLGSGGRSGAVLFPVGTATAYNPATITNAGSADKLSLRVSNKVYNSYSNEQPNGAAYTNRAVDATWYLNEGTAGGSNVALTLQWNADQELASFDRNSATVAHYSGGTWTPGTPGTVGGSGPYTLTGTGITSFSPFAVLNPNIVLPAIKVQLNLRQPADKNELSWKIISDKAFTADLERSEDGILFNSIYHSQGNSSGYFRDPVNNIAKTWYRIKLSFTGGVVRYSNIVFAQANKNSQVVIYPTLFRDNFSVQVNGASAKIQLYDASGRLMLQDELKEGTNSVSVDKLRSGIYYYQVLQNNIIISKGTVQKF